MEATIVLVLLLVLVFGGMTLMLAFGFISTERARSLQAEERRAAEQDRWNGYCRDRAGI